MKNKTHQAKIIQALRKNCCCNVKLVQPELPGTMWRMMSDCPTIGGTAAARFGPRNPGRHEFHTLSWLMGTGKGDFFISNTVLLGSDGTEVLTKTPIGPVVV